MPKIKEGLDEQHHERSRGQILLVEDEHHERLKHLDILETTSSSRFVHLSSFSAAQQRLKRLSSLGPTTSITPSRRDDPQTPPAAACNAGDASVSGISVGQPQAPDRVIQQLDNFYCKKVIFNHGKSKPCRRQHLPSPPSAPSSTPSPSLNKRFYSASPSLRADRKMTAGPKITLYVDIVSPFAYIAYHVLRNSPVFAKCTMTYVPVFLGGIIQATGNIPPIRIKNKDRWINMERMRWSRLLGVPITEAMPEGFPVNTLAVQRALCVIAAEYPDKLTGCIDALYHALWVKADSTVGKPEGYLPVLESLIGKDVATKVADKATTAEIKKTLLSNTDRAVESGAFGLPWMECTNSKGETESFFGVDHLGLVTAFLNLDGTLIKGFKALL